jgi:hypothetical protein
MRTSASAAVPCPAVPLLNPNPLKDPSIPVTGILSDRSTPVTGIQYDPSILVTGYRYRLQLFGRDRNLLTSISEAPPHNRRPALIPPIRSGVPTSAFGADPIGRRLFGRDRNLLTSISEARDRSLRGRFTRRIRSGVPTSAFGVDLIILRLFGRDRNLLTSISEARDRSLPLNNPRKSPAVYPGSFPPRTRAVADGFMPSFPVMGGCGAKCRPRRLRPLLPMEETEETEERLLRPTAETVERPRPRPIRKR